MYVCALYFRTLMILQLVFTRHAHDRTVSFSVIAEAAQIPLTHVSYH